MRSAGALVLLVFAAWGVLGARATINQTTVNGCTCLSECDTSLDSLVPWCFTTLPSENPPPRACGLFATTRNAYWDECTLNSTRVAVMLTNLDDMWSWIVQSAIITTVIVYFFAGCFVAYILLRDFMVLWALLIPFVYVLFALVPTFIFSAISAIFIAELYLVMPYALDRDVAITLGVGIGLAICYQSLGRSHDGVRRRFGNSWYVTMGAADSKGGPLCWRWFGVY